ncbi:hydroxylamine reductase [Anaerofustis stercorihominis]|uniref:hydroxylamine reductase n=1 Tax=Anaerofustis stercorihominis TaxID=214853 RepID=UPI00210EEADF|nr:hydroxylamine reductase [Anaerofustis stercorihominis]MCQ4794795.1 hydroxylamine reductase [Anaerofustis stercorihominis]
MNNMFCYQCQETLGGKGCTMGGVCGKSAKTSKLQDMLIYVTKGLSEVLISSEKSISDKKVNEIINDNLFITITNANFDDKFILNKIIETLKIKEGLLNNITDKSKLSKDALWISYDKDEINSKAKKEGVLKEENEDIRSLKELITYGLKGMAAYNKHANNLNKYSEEVDEFIIKTLAILLKDDLNQEFLLNLTLETGGYGVKVMALLDKANTETYGNPEITSVDIGVKNKPGILVSGHDLKDLEMLLEQTKGLGIDIYTHGEMLPAQYYPKFKEYSHFAGNYGNAWWKQTTEFDKFNGPILLTTNCLVPPKPGYKNRIYTTGSVGYSGCTYIPNNENGEKDFSEVIKHAKKCTPPTEIETGTIIGGFAHNQVLSIADKIVEAVEKGAIKKFVVMAGCDGRHKDREYYTEFAKRLPKDAVILTAGCAKYKYNKLDLGNINGIPRVLDAGQCNDSYSLAVIALKLQEVLGLEDINELPIVYNIAWYEQKAVIVLLALLHLGIKNIHLGPTLPAFLSKNIINVLVDNFGIAGIKSVEEDLEIFNL